MEHYRSTTRGEVTPLLTVAPPPRGWPSLTVATGLILSLGFVYAVATTPHARPRGAADVPDLQPLEQRVAGIGPTASQPAVADSFGAKPNIVLVTLVRSPPPCRRMVMTEPKTNSSKRTHVRRDNRATTG